MIKHWRGGAAADAVAAARMKALVDTWVAVHSEALSATLVRLGCVSAERPDPDLLRTHFGTLSKELVAWVRDSAPELVTGGELYLFRCPMADPFGFESTALPVPNDPGLQGAQPWFQAYVVQGNFPTVDPSFTNAASVVLTP